MQVVKPFINVKTINNITFNYLTITTFMRMYDSTAYLLLTDSSATCIVPTNDGRLKLY